MLDLDDLKRKAEAATKGPWKWKNDGSGYVGRPDGIHVATAAWMEGMQHSANAEFIAAANPATVLSLIAEIERLREMMPEPIPVGSTFSACGHCHKWFATPEEIESHWGCYSWHKSHGFKCSRCVTQRAIPYARHGDVHADCDNQPEVGA